MEIEDARMHISDILHHVFDHAAQLCIGDFAGCFPGGRGAITQADHGVVLVDLSDFIFAGEERLCPLPVDGLQNFRVVIIPAGDETLDPCAGQACLSQVYPGRQALAR